ncbi:MAG TPA: hypothetical protein PLV92_07870, partial [Pirellulaceae bacterium]|nr:hypothetical protein [Pirellulaceae bacterium]
MRLGFEQMEERVVLSVTSVLVTSPTAASPLTITSLPQNVTVNFNYTTSVGGTSTGTVDITCGADTFTNVKPLASGGGLTDSIAVTIPNTATVGS